MGTTDARDVAFAGAGLIWGTVTMVRGIRLWREESRRSQRSCSVAAMPINRLEFPTIILTGAALAIGCIGFLIWSLIL